MSTHDRGAFGDLLSELVAAGYGELEFVCRLPEPESDKRWSVWVDSGRTFYGRTGEEALRRLVESLR